MSAPAPAPAAEGDAPPKKSKLKLILIGVLVLLLAGGGGGAFLLMSKKKPKGDDDHAEEAAPQQISVPKVPPTFLALENVVVNLADPGGERLIQLGLTLQIADAKVADQVKVYMPRIRNDVIRLVSQRTTQDLLHPDGKEKLAAAILRAVGEPLGLVNDDEEEEEEDSPKAKKKKKKAVKAPSPIQAVLFSSFIIQ